MSNLLERVLYKGLYKGTTVGVVKGDSRNSDYGSSCMFQQHVKWPFMGFYRVLLG